MSLYDQKEPGLVVRDSGFGRRELTMHGSCESRITSHESQSLV
jgi:hypothetical protein